MPGWKDEYLFSLLEAERSSPVNAELVEACSRLNDRIASLEAEKAHWQSSNTTPTTTTSTSTSTSKPTNRPSTKPETAAAPTSSTTTTSDPLQTRLRTDLAESLRQKASLETRLRKATTERDSLQSTARSQARAVRELTAERDALRRRVRDQGEELRGKKQMMERVQDEVLALELQLNVAEQQKARILAENKHLIDRWMTRVRQEADDMNAANERVPDAT